MAHNDKKPIHLLIKTSFSQKNLLSLIEAFFLIVRQGRFLEVIYGMYGPLFSKPSPIVENSDFNLDESIALVREHYQDKQEEHQVILTLSRILTGEKDLYFLIHSYAVTQTGFVLGEYAENSARIFIKHMDNFNVIDFYH